MDNGITKYAAYASLITSRTVLIELLLTEMATSLFGMTRTLSRLNARIHLPSQRVILCFRELFSSRTLFHVSLFTCSNCKHRYVGKYVANLTLAQIKTLDCGSLRQTDFRKSLILSRECVFAYHIHRPTALQIRYPGTRVSTLSEMFSFLSCADPDAQVRLNIESKIDAQYPNRTVGVDEFVNKQHAIFTTSGARYYHQPGAITYQSFDWRTLVGMHKLDPSIVTSALVDGCVLLI